MPPTISAITSSSRLLRRGMRTSAYAANPSSHTLSSLRPMPINKLAAPVQAHRITSAQSLSSLVRAATGNSSSGSSSSKGSSSSITTLSTTSSFPLGSTRKASARSGHAHQFKAPRFSTRAREHADTHTASAKAQSPGARQAARLASVTIIALALANELQG